jgi:preprotein translocase subunit YajC
MNLIFPTAYAQEALEQPSMTYNLILFGGMFVLFYLILWRPQSKRAKEHKELITSVGKVTNVNDDYIAVEVAENVVLKLQKSSVAAVLPKGTISQI